MPEPILFPPAPKCRCKFCNKRRRELELMKRLEREWHPINRLLTEYDPVDKAADILAEAKG